MSLLGTVLERTAMRGKLRDGHCWALCVNFGLLRMRVCVWKFPCSLHNTKVVQTAKYGLKDVQPPTTQPSPHSGTPKWCNVSAVQKQVTHGYLKVRCLAENHKLPLLKLTAVRQHKAKKGGALGTAILTLWLWHGFAGIIFGCSVLLDIVEFGQISASVYYGKCRAAGRRNATSTARYILANCQAVWLHMWNICLTLGPTFSSCGKVGQIKIIHLSCFR